VHETQRRLSGSFAYQRQTGGRRLVARAQHGLLGKQRLERFDTRLLWVHGAAALVQHRLDAPSSALGDVVHLD
jgi:hypothetical protein